MRDDKKGMTHKTPKKMNHRGTETQRKTLLGDLCVSVVK